MKTRTTLLLLILVVALGVWIKFFESKTPNTATAKREAGNVVNFDRAKLEGITIQNGDDRIELRQQAGKWRLTAPVKDQADGAVVDNLISDLEAWRKESSITAQEVTAEKGRMAEFGLVQPKLRLRLSGPEMPPEIWFGKDTAFEGQMYVRFADAKDVYIAPQTVRTDIAKKADEFRDRKLTDLATAQVTRVVLKSAAGEIELAKKNEHWEIVKPLQARGDDQKIGDLVAQLTNARIQEFVADDKGDLQAYGLSDPRGSITIYGVDDKEGSTLQLGAVADKIEDAIYVRYLPRQAVYALPKKTGELLTVRPNDLRDRHLVRLDTNNLDRLNIEAVGQPKIVLARKEQNWTLASRSDQPANGEEVRRLLDTLNNQQVVRFVADTASELPKYGLDQPQVKLTFSSFASENTAETKAGEKPFLSLSLGKSEGNEVYARIGEEPFIVAVNRAAARPDLGRSVALAGAAGFQFQAGRHPPPLARDRPGRVGRAQRSEGLEMDPGQRRNRHRRLAIAPQHPRLSPRRALGRRHHARTRLRQAPAGFDLYHFARRQGAAQTDHRQPDRRPDVVRADRRPRRNLRREPAGPECLPAATGQSGAVAISDADSSPAGRSSPTPVPASGSARVSRAGRGVSPRRTFPMAR